MRKSLSSTAATNEVPRAFLHLSFKYLCIKTYHTYTSMDTKEKNVHASYKHTDKYTNTYACTSVFMYEYMHRRLCEYVYVRHIYLVFEPDVQADAAETPGNTPLKRHQTASPPKEASLKKDPGAVGGQKERGKPAEKRNRT